MNRQRVARKRHRCELCARPIWPGATYVYHRVTPWDHPDNDTFCDYRAHVRCDAFWNSGYGASWDWVFPVDEHNEFRVECWRWWVMKERAAGRGRPVPLLPRYAASMGTYAMGIAHAASPASPTASS